MNTPFQFGQSACAKQRVSFWILDGNNNITDRWITVTIPGDVDGDFDVDIYDIVKICAAYGLNKGDTGYIPNCDLNGDEDIDIYDVVIMCYFYGQKYP